jgi:hypothetical protein
MPRWKRVLGWTVAAAALWPAVWHIVTFVATLRARMAFPLDLEWMEGAQIYHAYRIIHGLYLYGDPARGFATFPYPPLYWLVVAAFGSVFGLDYVTGRAVSVACLVGATAILVGVVARRAKTRPDACLQALLVVAGIGSRAPGARTISRAATRWRSSFLSSPPRSRATAGSACDAPSWSLAR